MASSRHWPHDTPPLERGSRSGTMSGRRRDRSALDPDGAIPASNGLLSVARFRRLASKVAVSSSSGTADQGLADAAGDKQVHEVAGKHRHGGVASAVDRPESGCPDHRHAVHHHGCRCRVPLD